MKKNRNPNLKLIEQNEHIALYEKDVVLFYCFYVKRSYYRRSHAHEIKRLTGFNLLSDYRFTEFEKGVVRFLTISKANRKSTSGRYKILNVINDEVIKIAFYKLKLGIPI